jgi:hypothetical protein
MKRNHRFIRIAHAATAICLAMFSAGSALGADDAGAPGGFLRFGASARSLALGNAVGGLADDVATAYWNPAGLARLRTMEVTAMGATMYADTRYTFFSLGMPTDGLGVFSLAGTFTSSGEFERSTWDQDLNETFSEKEGILSVGYANRRGRFSYGVNLKAVNQDIGGVSGSGTGLDVGFLFRPHRALSFGAAVQNSVAPRITLIDQEEELARSARAGLALGLFDSRMCMTVDLVKTRYMDSSFRTGMEITPLKQLSLRAGYDSEREHMSAGAGFRLDNWQFDYAFVSTDLGAQNVVSATFRFGVPFGVKVNPDRALFSPSGRQRDVTFEIETAVRGSVEWWQLEIHDQEGEMVRLFKDDGPPPGGVTWRGDDQDGRLVRDGEYRAEVTVVDDQGRKWEDSAEVQILGFADRTRDPIRLEISGGSSGSLSDNQGDSADREGGK